MKLLTIIIVVAISVLIPAITYYQSNKSLDSLKKKIEELKNKQKKP